MTIVGLSEVRQLLDKAITYEDISSAGDLIDEGLRVAQHKDMPGEIMYFKSQREILEGNYADAILYLDLVIKHNPYDGAAYNDRALCMIELGMIDEAFEYFDLGIAREPDYANVYHNKGWLLNKLGQHKESLSLFQEALNLEPDRAITYENMADAYFNLGEKENAINAIKRASELLGSSYPKIKKQIDEKMKILVNGN
jgi:tetratricopeptide (TPR) repeat protein